MTTPSQESVSGWFRRLFGVKPKIRIIDRTGENANWRVGDLAVCLSGKWQDPTPADPVQGDILRVSNARVGQTPRHSDGALIRTIGLSFEGKPQNQSWAHTAFRKVVTIETAAEAEFTAFIKHSKPAHVPDPVSP